MNFRDIFFKAQLSILFFSKYFLIPGPLFNNFKTSKDLFVIFCSRTYQRVSFKNIFPGANLTCIFFIFFEDCSIPYNIFYTLPHNIYFFILRHHTRLVRTLSQDFFQGHCFSEHFFQDSADFLTIFLCQVYFSGANRPIWSFDEYLY